MNVHWNFPFSARYSTMEDCSAQPYGVTMSFDKISLSFHVDCGLKKLWKTAHYKQGSMDVNGNKSEANISLSRNWSAPVT